LTGGLLLVGGAMMVALGFALGANSTGTQMYVPAAVPLAPSAVVGAPVPAVARMDMEMYGKGKNAGRRGGNMMGKQKMQQPPTPPVDPDNEEFVMFVRPKRMPSMWIPYTIVTGGTQANQLVQSSKGNFAKGMFSDQLVRSMGEVVYRDQKTIEANIKKIPMLSGYSEFEYGFKIRNKEVPEDWIKAEGVIVIPPEDELPATPVSKVTDGVKGIADKLGFGGNK
jgi:hypothetical protein